METTPTIYRSLEVIARPAALAVAILAFLIAAGFGAGALSTERASAQPALTFDGSCTPDSVRPGEPALITCTVSITNEGTETATNLVGSLGPASGCSLPNPLPTFIDRTHNGELVSTAPLELSFDLGDLAPGDTFETVSRLIVSGSGTGVVGGLVSVSSRDDPGVSVSGETCWTVSADAAAPPTNLRVTKTLLSEIIFPEPVPVPPPEPLSPPNGDAVILEDEVDVAVSPPPSLDKAEFEIVVTNVSGTDMTGVTVLDVQTGDAVLLRAEPPPNGTDAAGRPTWDAGTLAPGGEFRIVASFGPSTDSDCAYADDIVVVSATPAGGQAEDYVALADFGVSVGSCEFIQPSFCEHFPPGDGFSVFALCDETVWWAAPPDGGDYQPVFNPIPGEEYCWFVPPATDSPLRAEGPVLQPCAQEVCWISFGPLGEDFVGQIPCDFQFCEYSAPDGSQTFQEGCEVPVCWSMPPGDGDWQPVFGCEEFEEWCWFASPSQDSSFLNPCQSEFCFSTPPPGMLDGDDQLRARAFDTEHTRWSAGVDVEIPLDRKRERNDYRSVLIALRRTERDYEESVDNVRLEVRRALRRMASAYSTMMIQNQQIQINIFRADMVQAKLGAGQSVSIFDVVDAQEDLARARNDYAASRSDFRRAVLEFLRDTGTLRVDDDGQWARYDERGEPASTPETGP
ncbi:MAG: TolC family protein [Chloroflexi bacterium]|nr:TolC family protein [Chloroflexota bacterium]